MVIGKSVYNKAMSYALIDIPKKSTTLWNEDEKTEKLKQLFKRQSLLCPENFYTPARQSSDLEQMLDRLCKHLGLRIIPSVIFSDRLKQDGMMEIENKHVLIVVNARYTANPYACAAILAHNLCHYLLIHKHGIILNDVSENEKVADLATIYSGLGIVVLNGVRPLGWRRYLAGLMNLLGKRQTPGLGYFKPRSYAVELAQYVSAMHLPTDKVASHTVPWAQSLLYKEFRTKGSFPIFMQEARKLHRRSLQRFWLSLFIFVCFGIIGGYTLLQKPAFLSEELRLQKQVVSDLLSSYQGCSDRVATLKNEYGVSDPSVLRHIDNELTKCKSLENRYNYEVDVYNVMLSKYDN